MAKKIDLIAEKIKERNTLYVNGSNPKRLQQLINEINYFYYGINENNKSVSK
jgi:hypothetical protein